VNVYRISKEAANDLIEIWQYSAEHWSVAQADRYYNLLLNEIEYLAKNPDSGIDAGHVMEGYCRSKVKSHFIFFRIHSKNSSIEIIRILHQRMDVESHLNTSELP
jgi:toxin ParE1/3/4